MEICWQPLLCLCLPGFDRWGSVILNQIKFGKKLIIWWPTGYDLISKYMWFHYDKKTLESLWWPTGYGHSTPATKPGKMFTVAYCTLGIPLAMIMFQVILVIVWYYLWSMIWYILIVLYHCAQVIVVESNRCHDQRWRINISPST